MGFFSVPGLLGWSFQHRIHGGVLPPPHCPDRSGPAGSPTDTVRNDSTLPPVLSKKSIVFLWMKTIVRLCKGFEAFKRGRFDSTRISLAFQAAPYFSPTTTKTFFGGELIHMKKRIEGHDLRFGSVARLRQDAPCGSTGSFTRFTTKGKGGLFFPGFGPFDICMQEQQPQVARLSVAERDHRIEHVSGPGRVPKAKFGHDHTV